MNLTEDTYTNYIIRRIVLSLTRQMADELGKYVDVPLDKDVLITSIQEVVSNVFATVYPYPISIDNIEAKENIVQFVIYQHLPSKFSVGTLIFDMVKGVFINKL